MFCSEAVKQEALERVVEYLVCEEARTLLRWRGQVMWHIRALCVAIPGRYFGDLRKIGRLVEFRLTFAPPSPKQARDARRQRRRLKGKMR